jgi:hypothetical protein
LLVARALAMTGRDPARLRQLVDQVRDAADGLGDDGADLAAQADELRRGVLPKG